VGQIPLLDLLYVVAFFVGAVLFAIGPFIIANLIAPRAEQPKTRSIYECGMEPIGSAWIRFGAVFYLYALMFLAFAVDVLYLFPVALVYNKVFVLRDLVEIVIFVGILALAIVYAWKKGVFTWERKIFSRR